ncbi:transposase [Xenorhabdus beddingii]|uniref:Transposase n=1 Tax=Xenorhabdus beddingii TaxID=40578 RepID=A0A1Y2SNR9_9GAMM|nr:transposase [Xenorhabdus beddingii]
MAGATARTAAELVGVNKTTSAYYFHRLRVLIADYVDEHSMFEGEIEIDESYLGGNVRENVGEVQPEKSLFSGFSSEVVRSTLASYLTLNLIP